VRRPDPDLVAVLEVELFAPSLPALFRTLVRPPTPVADGVDVGAVEAAEVAQAGAGRVDLEYEVVARGRGVARGETRVAVGRPAEEERVVLGEVEPLPTNGTSSDDEADLAGYRAPLRTRL